MPSIPRSTTDAYTLSFSNRTLEGMDLSLFNEKTPAASPRFLNNSSTRDDMARYVAFIHRPYEKLNHAIALMAGLLILGQSDNGFATYVLLASTPEQTLIEISDLLAGAHIPQVAQGHFKHLERASRILLLVARSLQRQITDNLALKRNTPELLEDLNRANRLLRCLANAPSGLMPVDLTSTCFCCNPSATAI